MLNLKRDDLEGGMGKIVWELYAYYVICWLLIYFIAVKKIYSYSKVFIRLIKPLSMPLVMCVDYAHRGMVRRVASYEKSGIFRILVSGQFDICQH